MLENFVETFEEAYEAAWNGNEAVTKVDGRRIEAYPRAYENAIEVSIKFGKKIVPRHEDARDFLIKCHHLKNYNYNNGRWTFITENGEKGMIWGINSFIMYFDDPQLGKDVFDLYMNKIKNMKKRVITK